MLKVTELIQLLFLAILVFITLPAHSQEEKDSGTLYYQDADGDGYGSQYRAPIDYYYPGWVTNNLDCDDLNSVINPGVYESGWEVMIDYNCDGRRSRRLLLDQDGDGYVDTSAMLLVVGMVGDADTTWIRNTLGLKNYKEYNWYNNSTDNKYVFPNHTKEIYSCLLDCNDNDAEVHPAGEYCLNDSLWNRIAGVWDIPDDGIDQDCNGVDARKYYRDKDWDGYGVFDEDGDGIVNNQKVVSIDYIGRGAYDGISETSDDCNDSNAEINPGMDDVLNNEIDENCDGLYEYMYYLDKDQDGYGNPGVTKIVKSDERLYYSWPSHVAPSGYVTNNKDCDDLKNLINPGSNEIPNNTIDENCDGNIVFIYYRDADGDGYGNPSASQIVSFRIRDINNNLHLKPPLGYVVNNGDCNDQNAKAFPGAKEIRDKVDNDCDGLVDERY